MVAATGRSPCWPRAWSRMPATTSPPALRRCRSRSGNDPSVGVRRRGPESDRRLQGAAGDGDAMHQPALAVIVVGGVVPGGAVVPERDRALAPAKAAGELGPCGVAVEMLEQRPAVLGRPAVEAQ